MLHAQHLYSQLFITLACSSLRPTLNGWREIWPCNDATTPAVPGTRPRISSCRLPCFLCIGLCSSGCHLLLLRPCCSGRGKTLVQSYLARGGPTCFMGPCLSFKPPLEGSEKVVLTFPREVEEKPNNALQFEEIRDGGGEGRAGHYAQKK